MPTLDECFKAYADSLSTEVKQLTEIEKATAILNYVLDNDRIPECPGVTMLVEKEDTSDYLKGSK